MPTYRDRVCLHVSVLASLEDFLDQGLQEIVQELALLGATADGMPDDTETGASVDG